MNNKLLNEINIQMTSYLFEFLRNVRMCVWCVCVCVGGGGVTTDKLSEWNIPDWKCLI